MLNVKTEYDLKKTLDKIWLQQNSQVFIISRKSETQVAKWGNNVPKKKKHSFYKGPKIESVKNVFSTIKIKKVGKSHPKYYTRY